MQNFLDLIYGFFSSSKRKTCKNFSRERFTSDSDCPTLQISSLCKRVILKEGRHILDKIKFVDAEKHVEPVKKPNVDFRDVKFETRAHELEAAVHIDQFVLILL